jgi:hypothetical protein
MSTVKIAVGRDEFAEVEGRVFGIVAVTQTRKMYVRGYTITHIATGWAMTPNISNKRKANQLAQLINSQPHFFEKLSTKRRTKNNIRAFELLHTFWLQCGLERYW